MAASWRCAQIARALRVDYSPAIGDSGATISRPA
jgi:hypothetical protein